MQNNNSILFKRKRNQPLTLSIVTQLQQRRVCYLINHSDINHKWRFGLGLDEARQGVIISGEQHFLPVFDFKEFILAVLYNFLEKYEDLIVINVIFACIDTIEVCPAIRPLIEFLEKNSPFLAAANNADFTADTQHQLKCLGTILQHYAAQFKPEKVKEAVQAYRVKWLLRKTCRDEYNNLVMRAKKIQTFITEFELYQKQQVMGVSPPLITAAIEMGVSHLVRDLILAYVARDYENNSSVNASVLELIDYNILLRIQEYACNNQKLDPDLIQKIVFKQVEYKKPIDLSKLKSVSEALEAINAVIHVQLSILNIERDRLIPLMDQLSKDEQAFTQFIDEKIVALVEIIRSMQINVVSVEIEALTADEVTKDEETNVEKSELVSSFRQR